MHPKCIMLYLIQFCSVLSEQRLVLKLLTRPIKVYILYCTSRAASSEMRGTITSVLFNLISGHQPSEACTVFSLLSKKSEAFEYCTTFHSVSAGCPSLLRGFIMICSLSAAWILLHSLSEDCNIPRRSILIVLGFRGPLYSSHPL